MLNRLNNMSNKSVGPQMHLCVKQRDSYTEVEGQRRIKEKFLNDMCIKDRELKKQCEAEQKMKEEIFRYLRQSS